VTNSEGHRINSKNPLGPPGTGKSSLWAQHGQISERGDEESIFEGSSREIGSRHWNIEKKQVSRHGSPAEKHIRVSARNVSGDDDRDSASGKGASVILFFLIVS
jgi:hypothetical protein